MNPSRICRILNWSREKYAWFQYETGLGYLRHYAAPDGVKHILEGNKDFWGWWKLNWNVRDDAFLESDIEKLPAQQAEWIYRALHDAEEIAADLYPNRWIISPVLRQYSQTIKKQHNHVTN